MGGAVPALLDPDTPPRRDLDERRRGAPVEAAAPPSVTVLARHVGGDVSATAGPPTTFLPANDDGDASVQRPCPSWRAVRHHGGVDRLPWRGTMVVVRPPALWVSCGAVVMLPHL